MERSGKLEKKRGEKTFIKDAAMFPDQQETEVNSEGDAWTRGSGETMIQAEWWMKGRRCWQVCVQQLQRSDAGRWPLNPTCQVRLRAPRAQKLTSSAWPSICVITTDSSSQLRNTFILPRLKIFPTHQYLSKHHSGVVILWYFTSLTLKTSV